MPVLLHESLNSKPILEKVGRDLTTLRHSVTVAKAARLIAARIPGIDEDEAALWGYFHDVGKLYVPIDRPYQHLRMGYEILVKDDTTLLPLVCLLHPFPDLANSDFIRFFFKGDESEQAAWAESLATFPTSAFSDNRILLIQLCDKLAGIDRFVSLEEKFAWYAKGTTPHPFILTQQAAYSRLKKKFDRDAGEDVYSILSIQG